MDFTRCVDLTPRGRDFLLAVEAVCQDYGICLAVQGKNALVLVPFAPSAATVCAFTIIDVLEREENEA
jgi:hypothetical protein